MDCVPISPLGGVARAFHADELATADAPAVPPADGLLAFAADANPSEWDWREHRIWNPVELPPAYPAPHRDDDQGRYVDGMDVRP